MTENDYNLLSAIHAKRFPFFDNYFLVCWSYLEMIHSRILLNICVTIQWSTSTKEFFFSKKEQEFAEEPELKLFNDRIYYTLYFQPIVKIIKMIFPIIIKAPKRQKKHLVHCDIKKIISQYLIL